MQAHRLAPVLVLLALTALLGESVPAASARVAAATAIAGPDSAIVELGGVAMAADGTGGLVYRRFEAGATHVFAARYDGSRWHPPQRVDAGQRFESAWPRIGAANNGQLVVTWTQDGPPGQDSLYSAVLPRGGQTFLPPTLIDWTVGEASATYPSLAMAPGGAALLAYRVVTFDGLSRFTMPGYVRSEVRLARFNGSRWSKLGQPVNRNRLTPQREPTAANSPKVAITPDGNGVVAWQEPDDQLVDRVWARRIFGMRTGIPLQASPVTASGTAIGGNADALAIDETEFGRTIVALRQAPDQRERASGPRIFINELPQETDKEAKAFAHGPQLADVTTIGGDAPRGAPLVALGETDSLLLAFPRGDATVLASGEADRVEQFQVTGGITGIEPALDAGIDGRGTIAFASGEGGGRVIVQQLDGAKPIGTQAVSGPAGGPVRSIAVAGSGTGDALVAFAQGDPEEGQIAVARVEAAPVPFLIETPDRLDQGVAAVGHLGGARRRLPAPLLHDPGRRPQRGPGIRLQPPLPLRRGHAGRRLPHGARDRHQRRRRLDPQPRAAAADRPPPAVGARPRGRRQGRGRDRRRQAPEGLRGRPQQNLLGGWQQGTGRPLGRRPP